MGTLNKPLVVVPAVEATTVTTFEVVGTRENYGIQSEMSNGAAGFGPNNSVEALIKFPTTPPKYQHIFVWQGDEYLAVRNTWTDETLTAKIIQILESE
jgi:hypothetical protein